MVDEDEDEEGVLAFFGFSFLVGVSDELESAFDVSAAAAAAVASVAAAAAVAAPSAVVERTSPRALKIAGQCDRRAFRDNGSIDPRLEKTETKEGGRDESRAQEHGGKYCGHTEDHSQSTWRIGESPGKGVVDGRS